MSTQNMHNLWHGFGHALRAALQWRLLLLWIVILALPTAIMAWPLWKVFGSLLDHSVYSQAMAQHFDPLLMGDLMGTVGHFGAGLGGAGTVAILLTLVLSPFLTGMVIAAVQAPQRLSLGGLVHGGISQYWRLLRIWLWGLVPLIIALILGSIAFGIANKHAEAAVLESSADAGKHAALIILIVLLVLAHAITESGRAQLAANSGLRSATRAFGRGIKMLLRRPVATLGMYLGTSIIGYVIAFLLGIWRINIVSAGGFGFLWAQIVTQVIILVLAWQRIARIYALTEVARTTPAARTTAESSPQATASAG